MWDRDYRDYKRDTPLIKERIESGKGFAGCEMHELNGWGNTLHHPKKKKHGFLASFIIYLFSTKDKK